jgi:hypothetical protein
MPDQVGTFLQEAEPIVNPPGAPAAPQNQPQVPFQTDMKLTAEQEKKLLDHAFARYRTLNSELGRDLTLSPTWWGGRSGMAGSSAAASQGMMNTADTFLGKRSRFDAMFMNDVSWRPWTMPQPNIFTESNLTVPIVRRVTRQMIARAKNAFFGTDPWFSVRPVPVVDKDQDKDSDLAEKIQEFCRFKLKRSKTKGDLGEAITQALVLGECAVKTSYIVRDQVFNVEQEVLHGVDGQPVRDAQGNTITQQDQFVDAQDGSGKKVLAKDGQTEEPLAPIWQKAVLDKRQVLFEGTKSEAIYYKDFLCPLTANDVQTADCIIHLYDKPVMAFVDLVVKRGMVDNTTEERMGAARRMVELVRKMSNNSNQPKAAQEQALRPNENFNYTSSTETGGPIAEFAEFYLWYDVFGDGVQRNIMLIADKNSQTPIFYDFVANVTTDGLRPIEIVRINPIKGRWYGQGICELFESFQITLDLIVNRWNYNQSASGRVILWTPTNTQEGDNNPNLDMRFGKSYTKKAGMKAEDVVEVVYLNDTKFEQTKETFDLFLQLLMNESGVATGNDAETAGLETSKLATGINQIQESGDELFKPVMADLREGIDVVVQRTVEVTLANLNPEEVFEVLDGDDMGIAKLTPDDVRGLTYKVDIELSTMKDQQQIQVSAAAASLVEKFYQLNPATQAKVVSFYRKQVRALDPSCDVNTIISPDQPTPPQAEPTKTAVTVAIKGENLTPEERAQIFTEKLQVEETPAQAGNAPLPAKDNGSLEKLGSKASNTEFAAQLGQKMNKKRKI